MDLEGLRLKEYAVVEWNGLVLINLDRGAPSPAPLLDGLAGEPMDVLVNGCLIAQGEVVVVNDKFGIRLTDIITPAERIRKLNR